MHSVTVRKRHSSSSTIVKQNLILQLKPAVLLVQIKSLEITGLGEQSTHTVYQGLKLKFVIDKFVVYDIC